MVFHEITQAAIDHAVNNPRSIDYGLVDAAETRRILDRLYGYEVSPVLWRRVNRGLSAGRVQSPSIRLIVERERERIAFVSAGYWDIELLSATVAVVHRHARRRRRRQGRHRQGLRLQRRRCVARPSPSTRRAPERSPTASTAAVHRALGRGEAVPLVAQAAVHDLDPAAGGRAQAAAVVVAGDAPRPGPVRARLHHLHAYRQRGACPTRRCRPRGQRSPASTASSTCRRSPSSTRRSRRTPRRRTRRSAPPRPYRAPQAVQGELNGQELALYRLVWQRTLASQMADATGTTVSVRLGAVSTHESTDCEFAASGTTITFPGYRAVYVADDDDGDGTTEALLPPLADGDAVPVESLTPQRPRHHAARPLHRGVARQAPRGARHRPPVDVGLDHPDHPGPRLRVEEGPGAGADLDGVRRRRPARAALRRPRRLRAHRQDRGGPRRRSPPAASRRTSGCAASTSATTPTLPGLKRLVEENLDEIDAAAINTFPLGTDPDGNEIVVKPGKYGPVRQARRRHRQRARRPPARRADRRQGARAAGDAEERRADRRARRLPGVRQERPLRAVRAVGRRRHAAARARQAEDGEPVQDDDARTDHASTTPSSCCSCRARSATTRPTARRSSPATAATARTS